MDHMVINLDYGRGYNPSKSEVMGNATPYKAMSTLP